jgi:hypothetical protein
MTATATSQYVILEITATKVPGYQQECYNTLGFFDSNSEATEALKNMTPLFAQQTRESPSDSRLHSRTGTSTVYKCVHKLPKDWEHEPMYNYKDFNIWTPLPIRRNNGTLMK